MSSDHGEPVVSDAAAHAPTPPRHFERTWWQLLFWSASIGASALMLGALGARIAARWDLLQWWVPLAFGGGMMAADFGSGLVHWSADTWGRDDLPLIGHHVLVPFRVHHVNPDDFLRRRFVDTNGDVAFLAVPVLALLVAMPLETMVPGPLAVFAFALCGVGMMTNQIHQWAHMPSAPPPIRLLQSCGLILSRADHAHHHERPYDAQYCITTGWCNRPLELLGFFRRLETAITRLTGARPRQDDRRYDDLYGASALSDEPGERLTTLR